MTAQADLDKLFPGPITLNKGFPGYTTLQLEKEIELQVTEENPDIILILMGTNDIARGIPPEITAATYSRIIATIKDECPDAAIYLQTIPPVNNQMRQGKKLLDTNKIDYLNNAIKEIAAKQKCTMIDIDTPLEKDNVLPKDYTWDGLHLSDKAYEIWKNTIIKAIGK